MKTTLGCCLGRQPCSVGMAEAGLPIPKAMTAGLCVFAADTVWQRRQGKAVSPQGAAPNLVSVPIRLPKASPLISQQWTEMWSNSGGGRGVATLGGRLSTVRFGSYGVIRISQDPALSTAVWCEDGPFMDLPLLSLAC